MLENTWAKSVLPRQWWMKLKRCLQSLWCQRDQDLSQENTMRTYFNEPTTTNDIIYQQTWNQNRHPTWRLIPIDDIPTKKPARSLEDLPPISYDPRLDLQTFQDLEEMNRQQLAELDVSNSDSSPDSTLSQDQTNEQDYLRRLDYTRSNIKTLGGSTTKHWFFLKIKRQNL